jgi:prepilin-type processing-associated H-X9-DG protein
MPYVYKKGKRTGWIHDCLATQQGDAGDLSVPDADLIAIREENGGPTFAAVTARSFHPGGVNALFGDGSVHFVKSTIAGLTSRALKSAPRSMMS